MKIYFDTAFSTDFKPVIWKEGDAFLLRLTGINIRYKTYPAVGLEVKPVYTPLIVITRISDSLWIKIPHRNSTLHITLKKFRPFIEYAVADAAVEEHE